MGLTGPATAKQLVEDFGVGIVYFTGIQTLSLIMRARTS
jgi:hypothetical protein